MLKKPPFDTALLDSLLKDSGFDVLLATSKHNVQYLLGGHRFFWFDYMDAVGVSRYLPIVAYFPGEPEKTTFIGNVLEPNQLLWNPIWVDNIDTTTWGVRDAVEVALRTIRANLGDEDVHVGIESNFLPVEAATALTEDAGVRIDNAELILDRLRSQKSPEEIDLVEQSSDKIIDSMRATFARVVPGMTKNDVIRILREEEVSRDLTFEYCLMNVSAKPGRGPSEEIIESGDTLCLDSGGNYQGYIGDLARMAVVGEPDEQLKDLLAEVEAVQQAARTPIRAGAIGEEIFDHALNALNASPIRPHATFVAHGMGLVSHEAPRLTDTGPVPYPNYDGGQPLREGMVLSIETTLEHPERGFIKLEDTVVVTKTGCRGLGDQLRGWTSTGKHGAQALHASKEEVFS